MALREADRTRIPGEVVQTKRHRLVDEDAKDSAALRARPDGLLNRRVDPVCHEPLEPGTGRIDHAERGVARIREIRSDRDEPGEQRIERRLRRQRHPGGDQRPQPAVRPDSFHRPSLPQGVRLRVSVTRRNQSVGKLVQCTDPFQRSDDDPLALPACRVREQARTGARPERPARAERSSDRDTSTRDAPSAPAPAPVKTTAAAVRSSLPVSLDPVVLGPDDRVTHRAIFRRTRWGRRQGHHRS